MFLNNSIESESLIPFPAKIIGFFEFKINSSIFNIPLLIILGVYIFHLRCSNIFDCKSKGISNKTGPLRPFNV